MCSRRSILPLAMVLFATAIRVQAGGLEELVAGLADESFAIRQRSTAELVRQGRGDAEAVQALCLDHFLKDPDPEVRIRCGKVLRELLAESVGFIGIRHQTRAYFDEEGELRQGVEVAEVLPGEAAQKSGLKVGDIIVRVDGKPLGGESAADDFSRSIRLLGAGKQVALQIEREGELREIALVTGAAPEELLTVDPEARFQEWLRARMESKPGTGP
jgi:S1-C subfamily serine protease